MKKILSLNIVFLLFLACSKAPPPRGNNWNFTFNPEEVLLLGNSHTYYNKGVDFHVKEFLTNETFDFSPIVEQTARGGYAMEDHFEDAATLAKVNSTDWDVLVLQENTYVAVNEQEKALSGTRNVRSLVANKATIVYLFMTWAYEDEPESFQKIKKFNEEVAVSTGAKIIPVGLAFDEIRSDNPYNLTLYDADGVHTTIEGTFLTAAMFIRAIYGVDPTLNSYDAGLEKEHADFLKQKAKTVYEAYSN